MHAVVQPIFEGLVVLAWCILSAVITDRPQEGPTHTAVAARKGERIMVELQSAVMTNNANNYVAQFAEDQRDEVRRQVSTVLTSPAKYDLGMQFKGQVINASSYEAQLRVKILITNCCDSKYEESVETALITIAPKAESEEGRFFSKPSGDPGDQDWEITKWETESMVPYDRDKDR